MPQAARQAFTLEPYDYAEARALMAALGLAEPVAVTLVRRGYRTAEQARAFLEAAETTTRSCSRRWPRSASGFGAAVGAGRRITVHGDYDVDGVCSTAILVRALRELGGECDWLIPGRLEDGYGLTAATVEQAGRARHIAADHHRLRDRLGGRGRGRRSPPGSR